MVRSPAPIEWHKPRAGSKLYAWNRGALFAKNMSSNYYKSTVQNGSIVSQNAGGNFFIFLMAKLKLICNKLLWVAQVREKSTGLDCWRGQCFGLVVHCKKN
jgi:hypothetical protein